MCGRDLGRTLSGMEARQATATAAGCEQVHDEAVVQISGGLVMLAAVEADVAPILPIVWCSLSVEDASKAAAATDWCWPASASQSPRTCL